MNNNLDNLKCLVFRGIENNFKIIKFKNRDVANQYYKVASRKSNLVFTGVLKECIDWCKNKNYTFKIIEREVYNMYE